MKAALIAAALLAGSAPSLSAAPLSPTAVQGMKAQQGETLALHVHHRSWHRGGRGLHLGWYKKNRGKHRGWRR